MSIPSQVLTQLQAIFEKDANADAVALVWPEPLAERVVIHELGGHRLRIVYCPSELAIREQLVAHGAAGNVDDSIVENAGKAENENGSCRLVILSAFDQSLLATDVQARIWRNAPQRISPWRTLQQILKVREIDPRLTRPGYRWIAKELLSAYESYKDHIHFGEVLDQDKAWQALTCGLLNYHFDRVDLPTLLQWSLAGNCDKAFTRLPDAMKDTIGDWLKPGLADLETLVRQIWHQEQADHLLAIGLACSVMYHPVLLEPSKAALLARENRIDEQKLIAARAVFNERYLGGSFANTQLLKQFGAQALAYVEQVLNELVIKGQQNPKIQQSFDKAEQMLASLDLTPVLIYSDILPGGFRLRLDAMAKALDKAAQSSSHATALTTAQALLTQLKTHRSARSLSASDQIMRAEMAIRLCHWLSKDQGPSMDGQQLLTHYIDHGSFVDWARSKLWQGDVHEQLSTVYQKLSEKTGRHREQQNKAFANLLPAIAQGDQLKPRILPVERALDQLVAPLARNHHVLLLVLDGMSLAVYRELVVDLVQQNWVEWRQTENPCQGLVSALPSITRASRCSLLSGELQDGVAADEKKAFSNHPQLKAMASTRFPPRLYHKADLQQSGSGALASEVRAVLAGTEHRVTAVVINAIDDQLSTNAQLSMDWKMDTIALLRQVMEAAREAGRVVIITSDHGHVLDHDMQGQGKNDGGERFKPGNATVESGELLLSGSRVITDDKKVVLPWSEKIRYTTRKMGYHGGASLQEVMIPLGIYVSGGTTDVPPDWRETPRYQPDWWQTEADYVTIDPVYQSGTEVITETPSPQGKSKKSRAAEEVMDDMFASPAEVIETKTTLAGHWTSQLIESAVYQQTRSRAGRTAVKSEQLVELLRLLEANGSQLMMSALVQALGIPKLRMRGFLAGAQKLLNVDGYPVLSIDRMSETVKLNIASLKTQFELEQ